MPHSHPFGKDWAVAPYVALAPELVVEIGPGAGMWSDALRPHHKSVWIGIEIWGPYIDKYGMRDKYDEVIIGDARYTRIPSCDLIIAGDVLEHIEEWEAEALIREWKERGCALLVSVPVHEYHQGAIEGNVHETHLWHPSHERMLELLEPDDFVVGDVVGAYWCNAKVNVT